jgi:hypothetical protein
MMDSGLAFGRGATDFRLFFFPNRIRFKVKISDLTIDLLFSIKEGPFRNSPCRETGKGQLARQPVMLAAVWVVPATE